VSTAPPRRRRSSPGSEQAPAPDGDALPGEGATPPGEEAGGTAAPAAELSPGSPPAAPAEAAGPPPVEQLVDQELARRERELRLKLEAEQRRLEQELTKAKAETAPVAGATTSGKPGADPARPAPVKPDPAAADSAPGPAAPTAPADAGQVPAGAADTTASNPPPTAPAEAAALPPPATSATTERREPPRQEEPPPTPKVQVGDLVQAGPGVVPPKLVTIQKPEYPPMARRLGIEGDVVVAVLVDENGRVLDSRLVERVPQNVGINEAAVAAARSARYQPATKEGVRVRMWTNLRLPFRL
jgi:protein TonB